MKFNVDCKEFAKAIAPALDVATKNCMKEFRYEGLLTLAAEKDKIIVTAYGGMASLTTTIRTPSILNYDCKREGVVTVYAKDIYNGLTTMEAGAVEIKSIAGEAVITLLSDRTVKRAIEVVDKVVQPANIGTTFVQSIKIKRSVFEEGIHNVAFAPAIEPKMFTYMCVALHAFTEKDRQVLRFSAGTGGRFFIKSVEGNNIFEADEKIMIIIPKYNLSNIYKVVSSAICDNVMIRTVEQDPINHIPEQIMISINAGNNIAMVMSIFGLESFSKYPNLKSIIDHKYSNRIYTDLQEWKSAVGAVEMSRRGHDRGIHNTEVVFDLEKQRFLVTPQTEHASTTPINIVDVYGDPNVIKGEEIWFKFNSVYLKEIVSCGKTGRIQLNFDSQEILKDIPDDKPKQMRPVLVKFPEKQDDILNIREKSFMFFTVSTK